MKCSRSKLQFPEANIAVCKKHREQFKQEKHYCVFATYLLREVMNDKRFMELFQKDKGGNYMFDESKATVLLRELSPLCCWLGEEKLQPVINKALKEIK